MTDDFDWEKMKTDKQLDDMMKYLDANMTPEQKAIVKKIDKEMEHNGRDLETFLSWVSDKLQDRKAFRSFVGIDFF